MTVRVLMVSREYPPQIAGGLGRHVGMLAPQLAARGHDVRVVTLGDSSGTELRQGVRVHRGVCTSVAATDVLRWAEQGEHALTSVARAAVTGWQPDVIHGHDWLTSRTLHRLHRLTGAVPVVTVHATESGRQQGWLNLPVPQAIAELEAAMCRAASGILVCSQSMAEEVRRLCDIGDAKVHVVGNAANTPAAKPQQRQANLLVFAGRMVHEKGVQELVKALPLIAATFPDIRAVLAGDGPLLPAQQDRARRYGVAERIEWPGFLDDVALAELFAQASVVVVPSLYEPFGLVALEAQLAGAPVAVSDVGGLREFVRDGQTGVRFQPESPRAIAEAVLPLLADQGSAAAMASRAQGQAQLFSWASVAARTEAAYLELLAT